MRAFFAIRLVNKVPRSFPFKICHNPSVLWEEPQSVLYIRSFDSRFPSFESRLIEAPSRDDGAVLERGVVELRSLVHLCQKSVAIFPQGFFKHSQLGR